MNISFGTTLYSMVSHDITNHCNARCKFCFNDWKNLKPANMDSETFQKVRTIIPFCNQEAFLFSCLFEPTLHHDFIKLLNMIPYQYSDKVFFTTNLVRHLTDDELIALCNAPVKYFNISLETFDRDKYAYLSGTKQSAFFDNLSRLAKIAKQLGKNKKIRIITMVLRSNMDELVTLVERVHKEISPVVHELRTPYISSTTETFLANEILTRNELNSLKIKLTDLHYNNLFLDLDRDKEIFIHHINQKRAINSSYKAKNHHNQTLRVHIGLDGLETLQVSSNNPPIKEFTFRVRINSDGTGCFPDTNENFNLHNIDDPTLFWSNKLHDLQAQYAEQFIINEQRSYNVKVYANELFRGELTNLTIFDDEFMAFRGHYQNHNDSMSNYDFIALLVQNRTDGILLRAQSAPKADTNNYYFHSAVSLKKLAIDSSFAFYLGYKDHDVLHLQNMASLPIIKQILR